jgi:DNA-binding LacI/PurR family transcriptional regulator
VLNGSKVVSEALEARVKHSAEVLGVHVRPRRANIRTRTPIIAVIGSGNLNPSLATTFGGALEEAERLGMILTILPLPEQPDRRPSSLDLLDRYAFDGIILLHNAGPETILAASKRRGIPMVIRGRSTGIDNVFGIDSDRESGMHQATKYILGLNHRRIAFVSGPPSWSVSSLRLAGIRRGLSEVGRVLDPELHQWGPATIDGGFKVASNLLNLPAERRPTAILAFSDLMAIGIMHAVRAFGLSVPEDVSVVGFDDIYLAAHANPPLTTVSQPKYQIGQMAVRTIFEVLNGRKTSGFVLLECPLVVRESTGPLRG